MGDIERTIGYLRFMEKFAEFFKTFDLKDTEVYEQLLKEVNKNPEDINVYIMMSGQVDKTGFMSFMAGLEMGFKFNQYLNKEVTK